MVLTCTARLKSSKGLSMCHSTVLSCGGEPKPRQSTTAHGAHTCLVLTSNTTPVRRLPSNECLWRIGGRSPGLTGSENQAGRGASSSTGDVPPRAERQDRVSCMYGCRSPRRRDRRPGGSARVAGACGARRGCPVAGKCQTSQWGTVARPHGTAQECGRALLRARRPPPPLRQRRALPAPARPGPGRRLSSPGGARLPPLPE